MHQCFLAFGNGSLDTYPNKRKMRDSFSMKQWKLKYCETEAKSV